MPNEGSDGEETPDLRRPGRVIPPATDKIAEALAEGDRRLLHCLDCGRQLVALRHGGSCLCCGSEAVVVEAED